MSTDGSRSHANEPSESAQSPNSSRSSQSEEERLPHNEYLRGIGEGFHSQESAESSYNSNVDVGSSSSPEANGSDPSTPQPSSFQEGASDVRSGEYDPGYGIPADDDFRLNGRADSEDLSMTAGPTSPSGTARTSDRESNQASTDGEPATPARDSTQESGRDEYGRSPMSPLPWSTYSLREEGDGSSDDQ